MDERKHSDSEWAEELREVMLAMRKRNYEERLSRSSRRTSPWVL